MKRILQFRLATKEAHLPKLIGAFILFAALLMFLRAGALMYDSWDSVKNYPDCVENLVPLFEGDNGVVAHLQYTHCKDALYNATGIQLRGDQTQISGRQWWAALLGPIAEVLAWAVIFILGIIFYRTGNIVIPIEQSIHELPTRKKKKR